jgi:hypothetical protein
MILAARAAAIGLVIVSAEGSFIMTSKPSPPPSVRGKASVVPARARPGGPSQDELLDEALKETFPASDSVSVYRLD